MLSSIGFGFDRNVSLVLARPANVPSKNRNDDLHSGSRLDFMHRRTVNAMTDEVQVITPHENRLKN